MTEQQASSILMADIGSTWTHVALLDRVQGPHRLIARAEAPTCPAHGPRPLQAIITAIHDIECIAQRRLLDDADELINPEDAAGAGVDLFVACSSAARPVDCALIGLSEVSLQSADRACNGAIARVSQTIALHREQDPAQIAQLLPLEAAPPDAIVITGGYDNGPIAPLQFLAELLAALFVDTPQDVRPAVVFAGNQEARRAIVQSLGDILQVSVVDNVRPNENTESPLELQRELGRIYRERKLARLPGMDTIARWSATPLQSTHEALDVATTYLCRRADPASGVIAFDVGGSNTHLTAVDEAGQHSVTVAGAGSAVGLRGLLHPPLPQRIAGWLPYSLGQQELIAQLENAALRPSSVPQTLKDLLLMQGAARVAVQLALQRWRAQLPDSERHSNAFGLIAGRGGTLAHCPQEGLLALLMLDALQPVGLARLTVDWASLWPQLGALALVAPLAASQVFEHDGLQELGAALCPAGRLQQGEAALNLTLQRAGQQPISQRVAFGDMVRLPLAVDETATIKIWLHPRLSLGRPGRAMQAQIRGGSLGLIVDARGRPLERADDDGIRLKQLQQWSEALCSV